MLNLLTDLNLIVRKDYQVSSATVAPNNANVFEQGQWFCYDDGTVELIKIVDADVNVAFPAWSKQGEGSTQLLTQIAVLLGNQFIADTDQYNTGGNYTIGQTLTVDTAGLLVPIAGDFAGQNTHAICIIPPDSHPSGNSYLRFLKV